MTDRGSPGAYRDELVAAQSRIAALEEKLADRGDGEEDDDPEIALLLQQRRALVRRAEHGELWWFTLVVALGPMTVVAAIAILLDASARETATLAIGSGGLGVVVAVGSHFLARWSARRGLPNLDARIVAARRKRDEGRRLRMIERELIAMREAREKGAASGGSAPRARVAVEDELDVDVEEEAGEAIACARRK